jgi:Skp family chaperone for outer membrane proteins
MKVAKLLSLVVLMSFAAQISAGVRGRVNPDHVVSHHERHHKESKELARQEFEKIGITVDEHGNATPTGTRRARPMKQQKSAAQTKSMRRAPKSRPNTPVME